MGYHSDNDHRRKKHKHDKYESSKVLSLMDLLLGSSSHKRRRSSRSSSESSIEKSRYKPRDKENRHREKRRKSSRRSSKHRRNSRRPRLHSANAAEAASCHDGKTAQVAEPKIQPDMSEQNGQKLSSNDATNAEVLIEKNSTGSPQNITEAIDMSEKVGVKTSELISQDSATKITTKDRKMLPETTSKPIEILDKTLNAQAQKTTTETKKPVENSTLTKEVDEKSKKPADLAVKNAVQSSEKTKIDSVQEIHSNLVTSWQNIVQQGLSAEASAQLIKKYRLLDDVQRFKAPILNPALKSLLNGTEIVRDDEQIAKQNHLGSIIHSIERGIFSIINSDKKSSVLAKIVESMNDAASFIAQLHYFESIQRRELIIADLGIQKMEIGGRVCENLFSRDEEKAILERRELEIINLEVEKRLAIAEKEIKESQLPPDEANTEEEEKAEEEEEEVRETPCSQRFQGSTGTRRFLSQPKVEGARGVKSEWKFKAEGGARMSAFDSSSDFPGIDELMKTARLRQGVPAISIPFMKLTLAPATSKNYEKQLKSWWNFCHRESVDVYDPTVGDVMSFMSESHNNGVKTSALKTARAALSNLVDKDLGKNDFLSMLFKGLEATESSQK